MNPDLARLQPYPFEKIRVLLEGVTPAALPAISLAIGEPKHPTPAFIHQAVLENLNGLANYPLTKGNLGLREAIAGWLTRRFQLPADSVDPEQHVIPVNGTREAIFAFAQAVIDPKPDAAIVMPNPFYQIYEGAAFLAGAEPVFLPCVPASVWQRCQLLYLCSPSNPTGAVIPLETLRQVLALAEQYDFIVASDECYSELYFDEAQPPVGLLQAAASMGNTAWKRCIVFHSLSKRSNAPGMRSGFVAGDADILKQFLLFRTYHGCAMPPPFQIASIAAWNDETHVQANREQYRQKFAAVMEILAPVLDVKMPDAGFYLWPQTPVDDETFTREVFAQTHVNIVPGSYLSRAVNGVSPGANRVRLALVASLAECVEAAQRIRTVIENL